MTPAQREQLNRFLALTVFTLLLSVGVERADGWHNAPTVKGPSDWVIAGQSTGEVIVSCEETTNNCRIVKPEKFPCYQKMQQAMRMMDPLHHITLGELSRNKELQESMFKPAMKHWDATMNECVK